MIKSAGFEPTEIQDPETGATIRVSTTTRKKYRHIFRGTDIEFMRNNQINYLIAKDFADSAGKVVHHFKLGQSVDEERAVAEIRNKKGSAMFFISVQRGEFIDILTIQSAWKSPKYTESRGITKKNSYANSTKSIDYSRLKRRFWRSEMFKVLNELEKLASSLDAKGGTENHKFADQVESIMNSLVKAAQARRVSPSEMPATMPELSRTGDNYSYSQLPNGEFVITEAPAGKGGAVGIVISESGPYATSFRELSSRMQERRFERAKLEADPRVAYSARWLPALLSQFSKFVDQGKFGDKLQSLFSSLAIRSGIINKLASNPASLSAPEALQIPGIIRKFFVNINEQMPQDKVTFKTLSGLRAGDSLGSLSNQSGMVRSMMLHDVLKEIEKTAGLAVKASDTNGMKKKASRKADLRSAAIATFMNPFKTPFGRR